ncbi:hypothetical protein [Shewanella aestuarii]|uniref:Uncharacterized protein n=1 Tax=Shewanella aestuarii TaxID=1028752 RepID=A0A6G9QS01_9GAMM|nr:hypothetical protein [Shewanella aestuarii]QIR16569.1 hypothetical protein HBH39_19025 [Shewanella aestuarii]
MIETINIDPFCDPKDIRLYLRSPFSIGEYTYAASCQCMIRVPRRDWIPEFESEENAKIIESYFSVDADSTFLPLPKFNVKTIKGKRKLISCDIDGVRIHLDRTDKPIITINGNKANLYHMSLFAEFANVQYAFIKSTNVFAIRFDGGDGVIAGFENKYNKSQECTRKIY